MQQAAEQPQEVAVGEVALDQRDVRRPLVGPQPRRHARSGGGERAVQISAEGLEGRAADHRHVEVDVGRTLTDEQAVAVGVNDERLGSGCHGLDDPRMWAETRVFVLFRPELQGPAVTFTDWGWWMQEDPCIEFVLGPQDWVETFGVVRAVCWTGQIIGPYGLQFYDAQVLVCHTTSGGQSWLAYFSPMIKALF